MPGLLRRLNEHVTDEVIHDLTFGIGLDPTEIARARGLDAADLVAAAASVALGAGEGPPLVRVKSPHGRILELFSIEELTRLFADVGRPRVLSIAAGLFQALDAWDASHEAAQQADDLGERRFAPYWHGIAHRREPDPGNAAYWFRRVGRHAIFPELAEAAKSLGLTNLARDGSWDPIRFIDFCSTARPGSEDERLARRVQAVEIDLLLGATVEALGPTSRPPASAP